MSTDAINGQWANDIIHRLAKENGVNGRKQIDTCNAIADEAKKLIENLNADEQTIYEISEGISESFEELQNIEAEQAEAQARICVNEAKTNSANKRLAELDKKKENGEELTEAEQKEYNNLKAQIKTYSGANKEDSAKISQLGAQVESIGAKVHNSNKELTDIADKMDGYKEAGQKMENAASKYGKNGNAEKVLDRNSKSWWSWLGVGKNQLKDKYADQLELDDLGNQRTFFDSADHEFISQYDAIEAKGKNQIKGKWRQATAKLYSYGKTIQQASDKVKEDANNNIKETDYKPKTEEE